MSNWTRPAILETLEIDIQEDTTVDVTADSTNGIDLSGGFVSFEYYESLLSPHITAKIHFIDTGYAVLAGPTQDAAERMGTLYSSVPTLKNKNLKIEIGHPSTTLTPFGQLPLIISDVITRIEGTKVELIGLQLISKEGRDNKQIKVNETYTGNVKNSVEQILSSKLDTVFIGVFTDTVTSLTIEGQGRNPFDVILDMAREATPVTPANASPGFFFYETLDGFHFRGVDDLISQPSKFGYTYGDVATFCEGSNFRILEYNVRSSMRNMFSSFKTGESINELTFNPYTFDVKSNFVDLNLGYTLGSNEIDVEKIYSDNSLNEYTTFVDFLDIGNTSSGIGTETNNNPDFWRPKSLMRYNTLFSKIIDIVVPCNVELRVGQIIQCAFPKKTDQPEQGVSDETVSGNYLILHLSHKFTSDGQTGSTTHMTIVRDTDGIYKNTEV